MCTNMCVVMCVDMRTDVCIEAGVKRDVLQEALDGVALKDLISRDDALRARVLEARAAGVVRHMPCV